MIHRQGPTGDVNRRSDGQPHWTIEHPHPWRARLYDFESFGEDQTDLVEFDGVLVWLSLIPRPGELGVRVSVQDGALHVEPLAA